jgi:hypothetical protein
MWIDSNGSQRSKWIGEPLPGKNDCTRRDRRSNCIEQQPNPLPDARYNQYYEHREWRYSPYLSVYVIEAVGTERPYPAPDEEKVRYKYYTFDYLAQERYNPRAFRD